MIDISVPIYTGGPDIHVRCMQPDNSSFDLRSADGTLRLLPADLSVPADLHIRSSRSNVLELLAADGDPFAAQSLEARAGPDDWRAIPPFDVDCASVAAVAVPGADAIVLHETVGTPVGTFLYHDIFVNGLLVERIGGAPSVEPIVETRIGFAARVAPLDVPLLEQLEGARLRGRDDAALMLVAGLYDRAATRQAIRGSRSSTNRMLARLAANTQTAEFSQLAHLVVEQQ